MQPFVIELTSWGSALEARWYEDFRQLDDAAYRQFADLLLALDGVEALDYRRYSATATLAKHVVTDSGKAIEELKAYFEEDRAWYETQLGRPVELKDGEP